MTKEELDKEAGESWWNDNNCSGALSTKKIYICGYLAGAEPREKRIAELEKKISILLSCKNCPNNKGGYICEKEYEGKCLSQKTQYIKELQEEIKKWKDEWQEQVQKANDEGYARTLQTIQLNKAKKIIGNLYAICKDNHYPNTSVLIEQAEQFLKECE